MVKPKYSIDDIDRALDILGDSTIRGSESRELEIIETDIPSINNEVFGCGGIPLGRIIELYGNESVGKSTFAYWLIGQVQKREGNAALFDAEGTYMPSYGTGCGINNEKLILPGFSDGEQALGQMKLLIATGVVNLIVADPMPAFQPLINIEQIAGEKVSMHRRLERAKMFTIFFNDLMGGFKIKRPGKGEKWIKDAKGRIERKIYQTDTTLIFVNHAKQKIGIVFGEKIYTPGGAAINFASSLRLVMTQVRKKTKKIGGKFQLEYKIIKIRTTKNKVGIPFGETLIEMYPDGRIIPHDNKDVEEFENDMEFEEVDG